MPDKVLYHREGAEPHQMDVLKKNDNGTLDIGVENRAIVTGCKVTELSDKNIVGTCSYVPSEATTVTATPTATTKPAKAKSAEAKQ